MNDSDDANHSAGAGQPIGSGPKTTAETDWAREALLGLAFSALREQQRVRRWNIFFRMAFILLGLSGMYLLLARDGGMGDGQPLITARGQHVALIDIEGLIASNGDTRADEIIPALRRAFENENAVGIVLRINSPGGSPVESGRINDEIVRLREKHPDKKILASVNELCASGAYYIAVAAEQIHANEASLIGSIGVISASFGFTQALSKMGIERRLLTAGTDKGLLDPFLPLDSDQVEHIQGMLDIVHRQFIDTVIAGRNTRLQAPEEELFNGLIWTGEQAVSLGLIDGLTDTHTIIRDVFHVEESVNYTPQPIPFLKWLDLAGETMANYFYKAQSLRLFL